MFDNCDWDITESLHVSEFLYPFMCNCGSANEGCVFVPVSTMIVDIVSAFVCKDWSVTYCERKIEVCPDFNASAVAHSVRTHEQD